MQLTNTMTPAERREWQLRNQLWKRIARARAATATMKLANERRHEIFIVVPDWRQWPVAPWYTAKLQSWQLMSRKQRRRLLRRVFGHDARLRTILSRVR